MGWGRVGGKHWDGRGERWHVRPCISSHPGGMARLHIFSQALRSSRYPKSIVNLWAPTMTLEQGSWGVLDQVGSRPQVRHIGQARRGAALLQRAARLDRIRGRRSILRVHLLDGSDAAQVEASLGLRCGALLRGLLLRGWGGRVHAGPLQGGWFRSPWAAVVAGTTVAVAMAPCPIGGARVTLGN